MRTALLLTLAVACQATVLMPAKHSKPITIDISKNHLGDDSTPCQTDAECPRSYCMNSPPHQPPFHCQSTPDLVCPPWPIANLTCQHGGAKFAKGCVTNSDCPEGYCLNFAPHVQPYVCQSWSHPVCACDCVSNWIGPECQTWNNTNGPDAPGRITRYLNSLASKEREAMADVQYLNPLTGFIGYGFDLISGGTPHLPIVQLTFENSNLTFDGHRLPQQAKFTPFVQPGSSAPPPASHIKTTTHAFSGVSGLRSYLESQQKGATGTAGGAFVGQLQAATGGTLQPLQNEYFNGDLSLGVAQQSFEAFQFDLNPSAVQLDMHVQFAIESLPPGYTTDTEKSAYQQFIKLWGTHYATSVVAGAAVECISKWDYSAYRHYGVSLDTIAANVGYDLQSISGLSPSGTPSSAAPPALNPYYKSRILDPLACYGGNPEDCSKAEIANWLNSLVSGAVPLTVKLAPVADLITDAATKSSFAAAIDDYISAKLAAWDLPKTCPSCQWGSCGSPTSEACSCASSKAFGRLCDRCLKGYGGTDCNTPICSQGCNAAHGHCTAPNQCTCDSCYAGPACMQYTCGCISADATVLTSDNRTLALSDVQVGDVVQSVDGHGNVVWSDVYYVKTSATETGVSMEMVEVRTEDGDVVRTTPAHLVYASASASAAVPTKAHEVMMSDVKAGQYLWVRASGGDLDASFRLSRVESVRTYVAKDSPVVSIHTLAGPVILDGVLASSYEWSSTLRYWENLEERVLYNLFPELVKSEGYKAYQDAWDNGVNWLSHMAANVADSLKAAVSMHSV